MRPSVRADGRSGTGPLQRAGGIFTSRSGQGNRPLGSLPTAPQAYPAGKTGAFWATSPAAAKFTAKTDLYEADVVKLETVSGASWYPADAPASAGWGNCA